MTKTDHDTDRADFDEDEACFITPDTPAEVKIRVHHLAVYRLLKAALVQALKAGAVLQEERSRPADDFQEWVDKQLNMNRDEAAGYIRFKEESGVRPEQLVAGIEVEFFRVLELARQLHSDFAKGAVPVHPAGTGDKPNRSQPELSGSTEVRDTPAKQAPKPKEVTSRPAKASERAKNRTSKATAKAKPVQQDRDLGQTALTAEQEQLLMRRSPKLFMQLRMGHLRPDEALLLAQELPDRNALQQT